MIRQHLVALTAVALLAGCSGGAHIINAPEPSTPTAPAPSTASSAPPSNVHLANAFDFVGHTGEITGYYFTTPSGKWKCAILSHDRAGCQAASSWQSGLGVQDEPDSTNAIVVDREGDPQFVALEQPEFWLAPGTAKALPFNRILAAAGFRCNVQEESGVSCLSEVSGKGFTFSAEGYTPQYTDVPVGAP